MKFEWRRMLKSSTVYFVCNFLPAALSPLLSESCDEGMFEHLQMIVTSLSPVRRGNPGAYDLASTSPKCGQNHSHSFVKVFFTVDHDKFEYCYTNNNPSTLHNLE